MSNFGSSFGIPAGIMCERLGARWTSLAATLISSGGFLLLWSTTFMPGFYKDKPALMDVYFFLAGDSEVINIHNA